MTYLPSCQERFLEEDEQRRLITQVKMLGAKGLLDVTPLELGTS